MKIPFARMFCGLALAGGITAAAVAQTDLPPLSDALQGQVQTLVAAGDLAGLTTLASANPDLADALAAAALAQSPDQATAIALAVAAGAPTAAAKIYRAVAIASPDDAVDLANAMAEAYPDASEAIFAALTEIQATAAGGPGPPDFGEVAIVDDSAENPNTASPTTL